MEGSLEGKIRFCFRRSSSKVAYCALSIKSGTRNEPSRFSGLAHFTEHMLFKGTLHRTCSAVNNALERLGGDLNAFTTKEETVINATVLKEDVHHAVDLLFDLAFCPSVKARDMKKEKVVVLDEIASYKDSPADEIFDRFESLVFDGHPLGGVVLGTPNSLDRITPEVMLSYISDNFVADNMCFTVVGDFEKEEIERTVAEAFDRYYPQRYPSAAEMRRGMTSAARPVADGAYFRVGEPFNKVVHKRNHQAHCIIGGCAYSLYDERRYALILLANMLGGPASSSMLNNLLREKNALVYNVEASYAQYSDTGLMTIYFACDHANLDRCVELTEKTLEKLRTAPVSRTALAQAKRQLLGQLAISSDNGETRVLAMGKSLMAYGLVEDDESARRRIEAVTAADLQAAACEILSSENLSRLIYN